MDINTKVLKKNAFRITKERGLTASRIRVPGGHLDAKYLGEIQHIAETFGNGTVHITSRQGFEIPGIPFKKIPEVNKALQKLIDGLEINQEEINGGYPAVLAIVYALLPVMIQHLLQKKLKRQYFPMIYISKLH